MLKAITPAIVLYRQGFQEADRKIVLMTQTHGKVTAYVRGVRWAKGKLVSLIEPFTQTEAHLHLHENRGLATLIGGILKTSYPRLRTRVVAWTTACYICELTKDLSPELLPNPSVFKLLGEALAILENGVDPQIVRLGYTVQFLREIGYGLTEQMKTWDLTTEEDRLYQFLDLSGPDGWSHVECSEPAATERLEKLLARFLEDYLPKPLLSADFLARV